jgi:hypothetical protein
MASRAPRGVAIVISNPVVKKAKAKVFTASIRELLDQSSKVVRSKKRNPKTAVAKLAAKELFGRSVPRAKPASTHNGAQAKSSSTTMTGYTGRPQKRCSLTNAARRPVKETHAQTRRTPRTAGMTTRYRTRGFTAMLHEPKRI